MISVLSLIVAIVALGVAIWLPTRGNRIAREALTIAQREERERQQARGTRARLGAEVGFVGRENQIRDGVLWQEGSGGSVVLALTVHNDGDRDAGRTRIEVTLPSSMDSGEFPNLPSAATPHASPALPRARAESVACVGGCRISPASDSKARFAVTDFPRRRLAGR